KHLHQHPNIPLNDAEETRLTPNEIYHGTVKEMYDYCFEHDLSQTWAYLWNQWYTPIQWVLWARAECSVIPHLKMTMIVESLWWQLKWHNLSQFNHPQLNLVTHVVLKFLLSHIQQILALIKGHHCEERPQALSWWQANF
ncbi:hypothetical protein ARMGADRAFT_935150, partial [Armillaria gallica]